MRTRLLRDVDRARTMAAMAAAWTAGEAVWVVDPAAPHEQVVAMGGGVVDPAAVTDLVRDGRATVELPVPDTTAAIATSSGTSGSPAAFALSATSLDASATGCHAHLGVGADDRWLLVLPLHHVAGLSVVWRSLVLGGPPVVQERLDVAAANAAGVTVASLVPTQLRRLVDAGNHLDAQVLLGGAALSPSLVAAARRRGHVRALTRSYGMTETAGGCVYDGRPLAGVEVAVRDGRLAIRGPTLASGRVSPDGLVPLVDEDGWLVTNDVGEIADDGTVTVFGRADDVVITGGINVSVARVQVVLEDHPAVDRAGVVGLPDEEWGEMVVAAVVPASDAPLPVDELRALVRHHLGPAAVPKRFVVVAELPLTSLGKVTRDGLRQRLAGS